MSPFVAVLLSLGLLAAAPAVAEEPPPGWGKIHFGMSEDEVRQALAPRDVTVSRYRTPGSGAPYVTMDVDGYEIAGYRFKGQFALGDGAQGLARMIFAHSSDKAQSCYEELTRQLEARYGKWGSEENAENIVAVTHGRKWSIAAASIVASFSTMRDAPAGYCNLTYDSSLR